MTTTSPLARFVSLLLFALALLIALPLIVLAFHNHPSPTDDYCFANTAIRYGFWQAQQIYYDGWSGRFFHNFIVHASPLVFGWFDGYRIYPVVLLLLLLAGCYALASQWLYRSAGAVLKLGLASGLFVIFMGTMASISEFMYWYPGMACYSLPGVLLLFLLATLLAHQRRGFGLQPGYLLIESLLILSIIGSSETCMVLVMSVVSMIAFGQLVVEKRLSPATIVLLLVGAVGCYFLIKAPGNAIRMGLNPNSSNIPLTLSASLRYAGVYLIRQLFLTPFLPLSVLYVPLAYALTGQRPLPAYLRLHPLLALFYGSVTVLALISLHFYGVGIPPAPRIINVTNLVFYLSWLYTLTLAVVALRHRLQPDRWLAYARPVALVTLVLTLLTIGLAPAVPLAYTDWLSGKAAQYDQALRQRYDQLKQAGDGTVLVAPLPAYPASMYMEDIKSDPQHLWNRCLADYFHKKTIVLKTEPNPPTH